MAAHVEIRDGPSRLASPVRAPRRSLGVVQVTTLDQAIDRGTHPDGVHRDRWTRPIYITPGSDTRTACKLCNAEVLGRPYQRATTFIDVLESTDALTKWKMRHVAKGLALRSDLVMEAASNIGDDRVLNRVCDKAFEAAAGSSAATTGTALHAFTEQIDRGESPQIPPQAEADIAAYRDLLARERLEVQEIEVSVAVDGVAPTSSAAGVGGKFDRIVARDGTRYVADIKTGKIDYGQSKIAMQLALYAMAKRYNPVTGERTDLDVSQDLGIVIHLPAGAGEASIHWADLAAAREGLAVAYDVWRWRQRKGLLQAAPPDATPDSIHALIEIAGDRAAMAALYDQYQGRGWTYGHELAAKRRLAEIEKGQNQ